MNETLQAFQTFACNKLNQNDAATIAMVNLFINNRYKMIWEKGLWKESKVYLSQDVPINSTDITLSSSIELLIQATWYNTTLLNIEPEVLFRARPTWLTATGKPTYYINRPKVNGNCVIRMDVMPDVDQTLNYVGKLVFSPLVNNSDTPLLSGIDNCLKSFVEGDCLEYIKQAGTATQKFTEAMAMLDKMYDLERNQQTELKQIQPLINDWNYTELCPTTQSLIVNTDFLRG